MPSREYHEYFSQLITGKRYTKIHKLMDAPHVIYGKKHREVWGHDWKFVAMLFITDRQKALAALSHIMLDRDKKLQKVVRILHAFRR